MQIFYIDDDADDIEIFAKVISTIDPLIALAAFTSPLSVIASLQTSCPDFIFLDYRMPAMGASKFITLIRDTDCFKRTKVVMFSTFMEQFEMDECVKTGAHKCVQKSGDFNTLCAMVAEVIAAKT
jgi:CheY-like chemotaxis protein